MKKLIAAFAVLLLMTSAQAFSQTQEGRGLRKLINELKLSDDQKKDVDKIRVDMEKQIVDQEAKTKAARIDLHELFKAENPDKSAIEKKVQEIADNEVGSRIIRIDSWFAVNSLLKPEQQLKWKKALEMGPAMSQHMGRQGGHEHMMKHQGSK